MEDRITQIEKDLSLMNHNQKGMSDSLKSIARSSSKIVEIHVDTKLLEERLMNLNENLKESFERIHHRIDEQQQKIDDEIENRRKTNAWIVKIFGAGLIGAFVTFIIKGGLNV